MNVPEDRAAWADFWATGGGASCLPNADDSIERAQRGAWHAFARGLPKGARVLDLGTGDGAVLRMLAEMRRDLALTGVDSAPTLPRASSGIKLRPNVPVEKLPFSAASFDAVTSQFGYEYGDTARAAGELARVLKPSGRLLLIVHRSEGPIVAHNLPRRDALAWALAPGGWFDKAKALVAARTAAPLPTPPGFRTAAAEAERLFPGQSAGGEFMQALLQTLELGRTRSASEAVGVLRELERRARNEIARIEALGRAARDQGGIAELGEELRDAGLVIDPPGSLSERAGAPPFAWLISGTSGRGTSR